MAGLDRDHHNNNLLDQLDELRRRLDGLERSALRGTIGPYVPDETITLTGYMNLLIHEAGVPVEYRLAVAETYAMDPVEVSGAIPIGGIIAWSGTVNNVPAHWALCDGGNGTRDLRDRFILGAGSTYAVGATGGATTVDASHSHGYGTLAAAVGAHHHHNSTLAADSASHSHGYGTLAAAVGAHHHHNSTLAADSDSHSHGYGTLAISTDAHTHLVSGNTGSTPGTQENTVMSGTQVITHTHTVSITSTEYSHNHAVSGSTASVAHTHAVSGEVGAVQGASTGAVSGATATDAHTHTVSGEVGGIQDASTGSVSGATATGGSATLSIMPPWYALCWIMRIS
jgi:hypothetical protein